MVPVSVPTSLSTADLVVVVDDDAANAASVHKILLREGLPCEIAADGQKALQLLRKERVAVLLTDLMMPQVDGFSLLHAAAVTSPGTAVVVMTAYGTVETAVEAMKQGAYDFLTKPLRRGEVVRAVTRALERSALRRENDQLRDELARSSRGRDMLGQSAPMRRAVELLEQVAPARTTVLLQGESGTGKEVFARALHRKSGRHGAFVAVNCAAIPETLIESELFGHERGAFTGAVTTTMGKFQQAHEGTLLLDEIGELPLGLQAKLLRVLQEGEVQRIGAPHPQRIDVRVVAATNRDLEAEMQAGRFRPDLYYRLAVIAVELPPLRARGDDIEMLAQYFVRRFAAQNNKPQLVLGGEALQALRDYVWPGNVRELENAIERAVVLARSDAVALHDLPDRVARAEAGSRELRFVVGTPLEEMERSAIAETLRLTDGDKRRAAVLLGIGVRTLYRRLDEIAGVDKSAAEEGSHGD
ncbi:MAG: sigma-54-dependent Fis family transcriptional regulator [Myxococcales bacterium]|nr:sigma-54-dependent Fis family transcriptional regulator [Myxococcales bacterium]